MKFRQNTWQVTILLILGAAWIWFSRIPIEGSPPAKPPQPRVGFPAPSFDLAAYSGEVISIDDLRGKAVIINVWASWCPPCRAEMPAMQRVYEQYQDEGLVILAVNSTSQDSQEAARSFADEHRLTFPILFDLDGAVTEIYQVHSLPTTFFVDKQGTIREVVAGGPMAEALLITRVQNLLEGAP